MEKKIVYVCFKVYGGKLYSAPLRVFAEWLDAEQWVQTRDNCDYYEMEIE